MDVLDDTQDLLYSTVQGFCVDSEEDEVFFGEVSSKEKSGRGRSGSECRRDTIVFSSSGSECRRKSRDFLERRKSVSGRNSLYLQDNSITEEDEETEKTGEEGVEESRGVQVAEISSSFQEMEVTGQHSDEEVFHQLSSANVTGRNRKSEKQQSSESGASQDNDEFGSSLTEDEISVWSEEGTRPEDNILSEEGTRPEDNIWSEGSRSRSEMTSTEGETSSWSDNKTSLVEMSGIRPLEKSQSGLYDSFSDDTKQETMSDVNSVLEDSVERRDMKHETESDADSYVENIVEREIAMRVSEMNGKENETVVEGFELVGNEEALEEDVDYEEEALVNCNDGTEAFISGAESLLDVLEPVLLREEVEGMSGLGVEEEQFCGTRLYSSDMESEEKPCLRPLEIPRVLVTMSDVSQVSEPSSVFITAPSSPNTTAQDDSITFDTSADEVLLYEMFGEDYDEIVEAMPHDEKQELKQKLENKGQDEVARIRSRVMNQLGSRRESLASSSIGSTVSPFSLASVSPSPSPANEDHITRDLHFNFAPLTSHTPSCQTRQTEKQDSPVFKPPQEVRYESTHCLPTASSLNKISPKRQMTPRTHWMPPSPKPKDLEAPLQPWVPASTSPGKQWSRSTSSSRIPQPVTPLARLTRPPTTPLSSSSKGSRENLLRNQALLPIQSPVAEYIKSNPTPRLVQNVVGKTCSRDLESTLMEVEDKENLLPFGVEAAELPCPLPAAVYNPTRLQEETRIDGHGKDYAYIPEAYGEVTTGALVTKHVSRVMVDSRRHWREGNESSSSVAWDKSPVRSVKKLTRRDSGSFDESMLEMSVVETKVVKKVTNKVSKGRGRP